MEFFFRGLTHLGDGKVWVGIYAVSFIFFKTRFRHIIFMLIIAEIAGLFIVIMLRYLTRRGRPADDYKAAFYAPWNKYSFPSHHSFRVFMLAGIIGINYTHLMPGLFLLAAGIGFSRIYLSKHYLSDVLAGGLLGIILTAVTLKF